MKNEFIVKDEYVNSRLDRWFRRNVCEMPQSLLEKNFRKGNIKINNCKKKPSYKLQKNDRITVFTFKFLPGKNKKFKDKYIPNKKEISSSSGMFVENNENFVVINKPAGIAVQSGTNSRKNIIDILRNTKEFENATPYSVHRIDKDTSGILIVAKNRKYAQLFTSLFRLRKINKTYLGVAIGEFEKKKGTLIDNLFHYEGKKEIKSKAITQFSVLDTSKNYTLLKLNPVTGRKHQLRKQLLLHGHPILGDIKYRISKNYADKKATLMLHAYKINFSINNTSYSFIASLSDSFKKNLKEKYLKTYF
jgi:23S rRNA pseudouridine955/2504/2580 synthase